MRPTDTMPDHHAGVAQLVERQLPKLNVGSSSLLTRFETQIAGIDASGPCPHLMADRLVSRMQTGYTRYMSCQQGLIAAPSDCLAAWNQYGACAVPMPSIRHVAKQTAY